MLIRGDVDVPRIAVVDDQSDVLDNICQYIAKFYYKRGIPSQIDPFEKSELLLYEIDENMLYDIYFLDIEMPEINGLELARHIRSVDNDGYIVFITSHMKFVLNGYDYYAYQFISKDNIYKKLESTLDSIQKRLEIDTEKYYQICTNYRYEKILYKDLYYIYKEEKNSVFVTKSGNIIIRETLKNIYKSLDSKEFIFVDRGYIVNIVHIMRLSQNLIFLRNNQRLKVSRTYSDKVKDCIHEYWKEHSIK